jgi:hypothetical protein
MTSMGASSRAKGVRAERELARLLPGARRVARPYLPGPDLEWFGYPVEVKIRHTNQSFSLPDRLLDDTPLVAMRADRGEWVISMRIETLLDLLDVELLA